MDAQTRWDAIYQTKVLSELSWQQREPGLSLALIQELAPDRAAAVLDVGGGAPCGLRRWVHSPAGDPRGASDAVGGAAGLHILRLPLLAAGR